MTPPGGIFAHIAGEDLVQGEDGRWWVLEDNLRIPSGASYPLFVRDIERRISPRLFPIIANTRACCAKPWTLSPPRASPWY